MNRSAETSITLFLVALIASTGVRTLAYNHPLVSSAIRDAYFIGSGGPRKAGDFLEKYVKHLPLPKTGPHVSEIEVRTPFAQVVLRSSQNSVGYSAQDADADYNKQPHPFQVRIEIRYTPTYMFLEPPSGCLGVDRMPSVEQCFHDFRFRVSQGKTIFPKSEYGVPVYTGGYGSPLTAGDAWLEFDTSQVKSAPLLVEVSAPGGQTVSAEFDLAALR